MPLAIKPVLVTVARDATEILPRIVFPHEVPVLEAIHGEGSVALANEQPDFAPVELEGGLDEAFSRLDLNYGADHVRSVYYNQRDFESACQELYELEAPKKPARGGAKPTPAAEE
ncbi:hypothetical protein [Chitinibacter tainanensis]|uniref:hypothetical protein n=1 Tax=Chitinibacter tainanensis TaxID=230667 RepID=UPI0023537647|nr:hypothetical protein [Chitinibacter tainanensis]